MKRVIELALAAWLAMAVNSAQGQTPTPEPSAMPALQPNAAPAQSPRLVPLFVLQAEARAHELLALEASLRARERALKHTAPHRRYNRIRFAGVGIIGAGAVASGIALAGLFFYGGFGPHSSADTTKRPHLIASGATAFSLLTAGTLVYSAAPRHHPVVVEARAIREERAALQAEVHHLRRTVRQLLVAPQLSFFGERRLGLSLSVAL